ncbi:MAG: hypothetical protein JNL96_03545 [Planctomycetaceae bacterium]|nr:hypothetical protein [Planctomycetaceae bacterium]
MNVRVSCARKIVGATIAVLTLAGTLQLQAADEKPAKPAAKPTAKIDRRGPIPVYYGRVVAPDQKESIYAIQDKYQAQIAPLAAQIKALMAQRDKEIEAVLTPEQLTKVAALKKEAASKAAAGKKPAAKKTEAAAEKPVKSAGGN